jgi:hypothetical protein
MSERIGVSEYVRTQGKARLNLGRKSPRLLKPSPEKRLKDISSFLCLSIPSIFRVWSLERGLS